MQRDAGQILSKQGEMGIKQGRDGHIRDMIKPKGDIAGIKKSIAACFRKQVDVTVNLGRNKVLRFCGELSGVYPALFTVSPNDKSFLGKTSYSYAEVLCGSVKIKLAE